MTSGTVDGSLNITHDLSVNGVIRAGEGVSFFHL